MRHDAARLRDRQLRLQGASNPGGDLVLHDKEVTDVAVEALGPDLGVGFGIDQDSVDADL